MIQGLVAISFFLFAVDDVGAEDCIILDKGWRLQSSAHMALSGEQLSLCGITTADWYETSVPKTVLAALVENRVYPNPYYGVNLKSIPGYQDGLWLVQKEDSPFRCPWWYRVEFNVSPIQPDHYYTLHFDGINYKANIWLNGRLVAGADQVVGMFRRFEFPITQYLVSGDRNVLAVEIIPPGLLEPPQQPTKQIEATTGWDDHNPQPPDMNMGLWQPVYLKRQGPVSLRHPYVEADLEIPSLAKADLTVSAWLRNNTGEPVECEVRSEIEDRIVQQTVSLAPHEFKEVFFEPSHYPALVVSSPRVWWPNPVGKQELYTLQMQVSVNGAVSDSTKCTFGIRDATTYINEEDWRGYRINGRNILIRGGAWMTIDMLLTLDPALYEALVRYAREANLNMLRSEGFSIRETNFFYDLCDRYGVMVTQQLFGRNIPDEPLAIACIEDTLLRIRNHPSLVHFLGHDETYPTETLDSAYRGLIKKHRIRRTYQPHSGTFTISTRSQTGGTRTGTRELWTYAGPTHYFWVDKRKFDSAWGFAQSGGIGGILAARDSIREMMPETCLWPIKENETWSFHTVMQGLEYFDAILVNMNRSYGEPQSFDDFCSKLYAMNYNSARGMFEAYAKHKYRALGITTWKYNAAWPAALTWHYVDWYKRATAAYYGAKKACTPLHTLYAPDDEGIYVANSYYEPYGGLTLKHYLYTLDGQKLKEEHVACSVPADGTVKACTAFKPDTLESPYFLKLELFDNQGQMKSNNVYWLSPIPDIPGSSGHTLQGLFYTKPRSTADFIALADLPKTEVSCTYTWNDTTSLSLMLNNSSEHVAFLIELALIDSTTEKELAPVYWSDNYVTLFPGDHLSLTATTTATWVGTPKLRLCGFNSTPVVISLSE